MNPFEIAYQKSLFINRYFNTYLFPINLHQIEDLF